MTSLTKDEQKRKNTTGLKLVGFILMVIFASMYVNWSGGYKISIVEPIKLISNSEVESAKVTKCDSMKVRMGSGNISNRHSQGIIYAPIAITEKGEEARGSYIFGSGNSKWCSDLIGKTVKVRGLNTDEAILRISSFSQLWYPLLQLLLAIFWLLFSPQNKTLTKTFLFINLIIFPLLFAWGFYVQY